MNYTSLVSLAEAYDEVYEGKIPWDNTNRPLRSGWTPREKNRAKRISTGVEDPNTPASDKNLERYGKLSLAHSNQRTVKDKKETLHKNPADYSQGRHSILGTDRRMPSESKNGNEYGLKRVPRGAPLGMAAEYMDRKGIPGAPKDEGRDKYYEKGPKGLEEPKETKSKRRKALGECIIS